MMSLQAFFVTLIVMDTSIEQLEVGTTDDDYAHSHLTFVVH
jgi:hypothetical protein